MKIKNSILLVEDDKDLREALYDTLTLVGFNVVTAHEGGAALDILNGHDFNLIVSDVAMKGIDGYALLKKVKIKYPQLPMLLMTAYADINQAVLAIREGAADYLVKPFEPQVLIQKINNYMASTEKGTCYSGIGCNGTVLGTSVTLGACFNLDGRSWKNKRTSKCTDFIPQ